MGAFDRFMRATAKRNYRSKAPILHRKSRTKHSLSLREELPRSLQIIKELEFGSGVQMMMKLETENLLLQKNPCTAYELAVALEKSDDLERSINIDKCLEELTSKGKTEQPWKDLLTVLQRLQLQTKSRSKQITCWSDAEEWLVSAGGVVLRAETQVEAQEKSLEIFKKHMAKTTEALARRFKMKNFKIRMFSQRFKEISHHRSAGEEIKQQETVEEEAYQDAVRESNDARVPEAAKEAEQRMKDEEREEEANRIASSLLRPLTPEEQQIVDDAMYGIGSSSEVIAQVDNDIVVRESMGRLQPGQWLNDEIIHYFLIMLTKRDEEMSILEPSRARSHFFKSFFITKLLNEGHANPDIEGTYEYRNVKRWSKKVPGKDIFKLNKIIFPINQGNAHWICGVAFMQEKRIQVYDSLGGSGSMYLEALFKYLQDEHTDKKKTPLPDIDDWQLLTTRRDTPRQRNGEFVFIYLYGCIYIIVLRDSCFLSLALYDNRL